MFFTVSHTDSEMLPHVRPHREKVMFSHCNNFGILLNVFGAKWETADKEKAALAELQPHIMDLQTENQKLFTPEMSFTYTSSAEAFSQW